VRNGADIHTGRRVAELYRRAGLEDVEVEVRATLYPVGHSRRTIRADLVRSMRPQFWRWGWRTSANLMSSITLHAFV
jgi:hypothetical protein